MWRVVVARSVERSLSRFPAPDRERLVGAIRELSADPRRGDVKRLHGRSAQWRRRVGSYRIFYVIDDDMRAVEIIGIERRTSITY